jgi:hypothetical protein
MTGVIMKMERSFGFLVDEAHTKRWFHRRAMVGPLRPTVGLVVEFEPATDLKGRLQAVQLRPIPQAPFAPRATPGGAPPREGSNISCHLPLDPSPDAPLRVAGA